MCCNNSVPRRIYFASILSSLVPATMEQLAATHRKASAESAKWCYGWNFVGCGRRQEIAICSKSYRKNNILPFSSALYVLRLSCTFFFALISFRQYVNFSCYGKFCKNSGILSSKFVLKPVNFLEYFHAILPKQYNKLTLRQCLVFRSSKVSFVPLQENKLTALFCCERSARWKHPPIFVYIFVASLHCRRRRDQFHNVFYLFAYLWWHNKCWDYSITNFVIWLMARGRETFFLLCS